MRVKFSDFVSIFHDQNIIILCVCVHFRPECPMDMTGKCPLGIVYVKPPECFDMVCESLRGGLLSNDASCLFKIVKVVFA